MRFGSELERLLSHRSSSCPEQAYEQQLSFAPSPLLSVPCLPARSCLECLSDEEIRGFFSRKCVLQQGTFMTVLSLTDFMGFTPVLYASEEIISLDNI